MLAEAAISIDPVTVLSRVLHTTCAGTLLGGLIYLRFVLAPAATGPEGEGVLFAGRGRAWAMCVGVCTGLLLVSGTYNFYLAITQNEKLPPLYHMVFGVKFLLAFVVFAIAALTAGKTGAARKVRRKLPFWLNVAVACALAIFLCGAVLRNIPKTPRDVPILDPPAVEGPEL